MSRVSWTRGEKFSYSPIAVVDFDTFGEYNVPWKSEFMETLKMEKELSEMTLEELWELFPIFLVQHDDKWEDAYREIEATM